MKAFFQVDDELTNPLFVATVEDNKDPTFNYRVKVRIPDIHPDIIKTEELPWAARLCNSFMGVGDEQDLDHAIPEVGTQVLVLAVGNNLNSLVYLGNLYKKTAQTPTDDRYLNTYGIYRKDGQFIGIDKIKKLFQMLFDGDIEVDKVHNIKVNATDNITVNCKSAILNSNTATVNTKSTTTVNAEGNLNVTAPTSTFNGNIECTGMIHANQVIKSDVDCISGVISGMGHIHKVPQASSGTLPSEPPQ